MKLTYTKSNYDAVFTGYADSDWGGAEKGRSTSGFLFKMFGSATISWETRKQASVAASTTEAEYMALFEATREALWLKALALSIGIVIDKPIKIHEDNQGCIDIAENPKDHNRTKHIGIKYHFSRERIETNYISLSKIPTGEQLADTLTKPLHGPQLSKMRLEMGLIETKENH